MVPGRPRCSTSSAGSSAPTRESSPTTGLLWSSTTTPTTWPSSASPAPFRAWGSFAGLSVLENVMVGAHSGLHCDIGSAILGTWRSSREERQLTARAREHLEELGISAYARQLPATLPYSIQKRTALARALMARAQPPPPRRAGQWAVERRDGRAGHLDPGAEPSDGRAARGAPHGPRDVGLRPAGRAEFRPGDRRWDARNGPIANPEVATAYLGDEVHESAPTPGMSDDA